MQQRDSAPGLSSISRLLLAGASAAVTTLLVTAWSLEPDPRGWGTHEQLGLTPCFFRQEFGFLCPTCGMTTAWSHAVRGNFARAASANLAGTLLCLAAAVAVPWLFISSVRGKWQFGTANTSWWIMLLVAWLGIALLDWLCRCLPY